MSYTNGGIFEQGGVSMPSPLVAARSQYPSLYHGSSFFQPQSIPEYRDNPLAVPGLGEFQFNLLCGVGTTPGSEWMRPATFAAIGAAIGAAVGGLGGGLISDRKAAAMKANMGTAGKGAVGGALLGAIVGGALGQYGKCVTHSGTPATPSAPTSGIGAYYTV